MEREDDKGADKNKIICPTCGGTGSHPWAQSYCPECDGHGYICDDFYEV